jgi:hypothetical protein
MSPLAAALWLVLAGVDPPAADPPRPRPPAETGAPSPQDEEVLRELELLERLELLRMLELLDDGADAPPPAPRGGPAPEASEPVPPGR